MVSNTSFEISTFFNLTSNACMVDSLLTELYKHLIVLHVHNYHSYLNKTYFDDIIMKCLAFYKFKSQILGFYK